MQSINLIKSNELKFKDTSWDFQKAFTKYSNHGFHTYPAMMIPQVARRLIQMYGKDKEVLLDPFMGSGTTALAAKNLKRKYIGIDISPDYCEMAIRRIDNGAIIKEGELSMFSQSSFI